MKIEQLAKAGRRLGRHLNLCQRNLNEEQDLKKLKAHSGRMARIDAAHRRLLNAILHQVPTKPHRCALPLKKQRKQGLI